MSIDIDPELLSKLAQIPPDATDVDFEALGIDVTDLQAQLKELLEANVTEQFQQQANAYGNFDLLTHPLFLAFYLILIVFTLFALRSRSFTPSIVYIVCSVFLIKLEGVINTFLRDTIGEMESLWEENPFDITGIFYTITILQPVTIGMVIVSCGILASLFYNWFCRRDTTVTVDKNKAKKD